MRRNLMCRRIAWCGFAAFLMFVASSAIAAEKYQIHISPMPFNDATHAVMTGKGTATATLDGETLTITGPRSLAVNPRKRIWRERGPAFPELRSSTLSFPDRQESNGK